MPKNQGFTILFNLIQMLIANSEEFRQNKKLMS